VYRIKIIDWNYIYIHIRFITDWATKKMFILSLHLSDGVMCTCC